MQKYAKYTPITGTHSLYTFYLYSTSLVVFTKRKKRKKKLHLHKNPQYTYHYLRINILSLTLFYFSIVLRHDSQTCTRKENKCSRGATRIENDRKRGTRINSRGKCRVIPFYAATNKTVRIFGLEI